MMKIGIFRNPQEWQQHASRAPLGNGLPPELPTEWPVLVYRINHPELLHPLWLVIPGRDISDLLRAVARQAETEIVERWKQFEKENPPIP